METIRGSGLKAAAITELISLIQTAEGALNETHDILQRMRELAVQSANDTNTDDDRAELQKEITQLQTEITRIAENTEFNTKTLMNGDLDGINTEFTANNVTAVSAVTANSADSGTYKIAQTVTYADTETSTGSGQYAFESVEIEIFGTDGTTSLGTVNFTAEDISSGKLTKVVTGSDGEEFEVTIDSAIAENGTSAGTQEQTDTDDIVVTDKSLIFHIGANDGQNIKLAISDMSAEALNVASVDISTQTGADTAIETIDGAIKLVSQERSKLGAYQNRLDHTINNLSTSSENLTAAESRIRDVDMAKEMMEQTKNAILSQAAQAMLAQANQLPQGVLQLLR